MTLFSLVKCPFWEHATGTQKQKKSSFGMKKKLYVVGITSSMAQDEFSTDRILVRKNGALKRSQTAEDVAMECYG
jgi:hypothetical protein